MGEEYKLSFEREVPLTPAQCFDGWTNPETLVKWFCPRPWMTTYALVELRPGGAFDSIMEGPNGEKNEGNGCILEFETDRKLVWTNLMRSDFIPNEIPEGAFGFVGKIEFTPKDEGSIYRATVYHSNEAGMKLHAEMGFEAGWNAALDQLIELYQN